MDKIGDKETFKDGTTKTYAGEKYGYVTPEKYQELFDNGRLARGQQFIDTAVESSVHTLKRGYNSLPDNFHNSVSAVKNDWDNIPDEVKSVFNTAFKWTLMPTLRGAASVLPVLDAPVNAAYWVSKKVDPTGRGISKDAIGLAELFIGTGIAKKGVKKIAKRGSKFLDDIQTIKGTGKKLVLAGDIPVNGKVVNGANGANGFHTPMKITVHDSESLVDKKLLKSKETKKYHDKVDKHIKIGSQKGILNDAKTTPPKNIDDTPYIYKDDTFIAGNNAVIKDPKNPNTVWQHHLFPKAEEAAFLDVMMEIGDKDDVVNLLAISKHYGVGGGGRMSGMLNMPNKTHVFGGKGEMLHPWRKSQKGFWGLKSLEPNIDELKTVLRQRSGGNSTKLTQLFKEYIIKNAKPSRVKAIELQKPYNHELLLPKGLKKSKQLLDPDYIYDLVHDPDVSHWFDQFTAPRASK